MVSIKTIYSRAFAVLRKKPFLLWGISLLAMLLSALSVPLLGVIPAASIAVSMLLQTAMTLIYLRGYRGEEIAVTQLFDTFKDWKTVKRVLCGRGWASLWIFLWSLIPVAGIVFGIIRTYEYRLTPYILMHEPDVPITEAIKVSRETGHVITPHIMVPLVGEVKELKFVKDIITSTGGGPACAAGHDPVYRGPLRHSQRGVHDCRLPVWAAVPRSGAGRFL